MDDTTRLLYLARQEVSLPDMQEVKAGKLYASLAQVADALYAEGYQFLAGRLLGKLIECRDNAELIELTKKLTS